jgi:hypothetical protein
MRHICQFKFTNSLDLVDMQIADSARMTMTQSIPAEARTPDPRMFLLAAFAVGQALHVNDGNLHPVALVWIVIAMVSLAMGLTGRAMWISKAPLVALAVVCLGIEWLDLLAWGIGFRRAPAAPVWEFVAAMIIAGAGAATLLLQPKLRRIGLILLIVGHTLVGADVIRHTKPPFIDVFYFQQESTSALLHGHNPYEVRYRNIYAPATDYYGADICNGEYLTVSHPYPPLTLLMAAPARLLGDVRWAHLAALELAALLIAIAPAGHFIPFSPGGFAGSIALSPKYPARPPGLNGEEIAPLAAALLLFCPRALMVVYFAWTEAMVAVCVAMVVYSAIRAPRYLWVALGLALASKQYMVLLLPLMLRWTDRRQVAKSLALAAAITLPFFLWNPAAFMRSVVLMQLRQPFRVDALSFPAIIARFTGVQIPAVFGLFVAGAVIFWTWRVAPRTIAGFAVASALILIAFFVFNKQAFCNYYFLTVAASCGAAATCGSRPASAALQPESQMRLAA